MRKQTLRAIALLSLLLSLAALSARAQSTSSVVITIPFDFKVAGKTLPAGDYIVRRSTQASAEGLLIRRTNSRASAFILTKPVQAGAKQEDSKLVFNRYGNQYFLSQVWTSGRSFGRELFKSRQERSLEREMARNGAEPQTVAVIVSQQ